MVLQEILMMLMYFRLLNSEILPKIATKEDGTDVYPHFIGDSAFPICIWLQKSEHQRYFNYRLSRAEMVTGAYGIRLKGRWRILLRTNVTMRKVSKLFTLASIYLHNICIEINV